MNCVHLQFLVGDAPKEEKEELKVLEDAENRIITLVFLQNF